MPNSSGDRYRDSNRPKLPESLRGRYLCGHQGGAEQRSGWRDLFAKVFGNAVGRHCRRWPGRARTSWLMQILLYVRIICVVVVWALLGAGSRAAESPANPSNPRPPKDYLDFAMRNDGNVNRGKELFFSETKASCFKCHS